MEDFIKNQEVFNKEIESRIQKFELDTMDHGKRLNVLEKEINTMSIKFERMLDTMDRANDKLDNHAENINDLKLKFPTFMAEFVDKNAERTQEIVSNHQVKCSKDMETKFLSLPEGWKGYAIRGIVLILGTLFGLDMTGFLSSNEKSEPHHKQYMQRFDQGKGTLMFKDQSGNTFYLKAEVATDTHQ